MDPDDIVLWADGFWCFAAGLHEFAHRSDDYVRIEVDSPSWQALVTE